MPPIEENMKKEYLKRNTMKTYLQTIITINYHYNTIANKKNKK